MSAPCCLPHLVLQLQCRCRHRRLAAARAGGGGRGGGGGAGLGEFDDSDVDVRQGTLCRRSQYSDNHILLVRELHGGQQRAYYAPSFCQPYSGRGPAVAGARPGVSGARRIIGLAGTRLLCLSLLLRLRGICAQFRRRGGYAHDCARLRLCAHGARRRLSSREHEQHHLRLPCARSCC